MPECFAHTVGDVPFGDASMRGCWLLAHAPIVACRHGFLQPMVSYDLRNCRAMHNDLCMPDEPLIGTAEACEVIGIDRSTLTRWVAQEKIRAAQKLPGQSGAYLFRRTEVQRVAALARASA